MTATRTRPVLPLFAAVILGAGTVLAGCAEVRSTMRTGERSERPTATSAPYDLQFIDTLAEHHRTGLELTRTAHDRASLSEVKSLASHLERDDADEIARLRAMRAMWFGSRAKAVNPNMPGMTGLTAQDLEELKGLVGADFDRLFIDTMIAHHEGSVAMAQDAREKVSRPELKEIAEEVLRETQDHIELLEQWKSELLPGEG
jgi:uncharacterized protein (DUF305 family)